MERNIDAFTGENSSGSLRLEFTRIENLRDYLFIVNSKVENGIALYSDAELFVWNFFEGDLNFDFAARDKNGSPYYPCKIKGYIPKDIPEVKNSLEYMVNHRYLVVEHDANGYKTVVGDKTSGCLFSFKVKHGNAKRRNHYEFTFTYNSLTAPPSIEPAVTALVPVTDGNWDDEDSATGN